MKSNIFPLTKALLRNTLRGDKNSKINIIFILLLILVPTISFPIYLGTTELLKTFSGVGINPLSILSIVLPIGFVIIIFTSIFSIISTFYFSSDIDKLLPLPLKPWEILVAKFIVSLIVDYALIIAILLPILLGIGVSSDVNAIYYIYTAIICIVFPIIPTAILSMIITSLMKFTGLAKSKDKFAYIVSLISIVFSFALSFGSTYLVESITENIQAAGMDIQEFLDSYSNAIMSFFFVLYPAYLSLYNFSSLISVLYIILYIAISIGFIVLFSFIGQKFYLKGIMGGKNTPKEKTIKIGTLTYKNQSPFTTLISKEFKTIWRSPSFNMNLLLVEILMPFILVVSFSISFVAKGEEETSLLLSLLEMIDLKSSLAMGIAFLVASFFTSMSLSSPTAFSREGKNASNLKSLPIKTSTLIHSKMFFGIISSLIIYAILGLLMVMFGFLHILDFIFLTVSVVPFTILMNYVGIFIDMFHPKLNWDSENAAVKQNFNGVIYMFGIWIIGGLITWGSYYFPFEGYILASVIGVISIIGCIAFYIYIQKKDIKLLNKIG